METGTAIVLGLAAGLGAWWLLKGSQPGAIPPVRPPLNPPPEFGKSSSDLGPFKTVLTLPGVGQAYNVLAPINDKMIQPILSDINTSGPIKAVNAALGGQPTVTTHDDGTITRTAPNTWWSRNVGGPVSSGITGAFHAIGL